jgi:hypothetical protein
VRERSVRADPYLFAALRAGLTAYDRETGDAIAITVPSLSPQAMPQQAGAAHVRTAIRSGGAGAVPPS